MICQNKVWKCFLGFRLYLQMFLKVSSNIVLCFLQLCFLYKKACSQQDRQVLLRPIASKTDNLTTKRQEGHNPKSILQKIKSLNQIPDNKNMKVVCCVTACKEREKNTTLYKKMSHYYAFTARPLHTKARTHMHKWDCINANA